MSEEPDTVIRPYPDDPDAAADFERWMHWGSVAQGWTQQDAKDFLNGFIDGIESQMGPIQARPRRPWWKRLFRR